MSRVYVTGDTHGDFTRFSARFFPDQIELTKEDIVIILGDFGGIWEQTMTKDEEWWLDWLNDKNFTLAFIDGNHENFDRLDNDFPIVEFYGGKAHQIKPSIFHLIRGEVYNINGYNLLAFGGAASHDIEDGILDIKDYTNRAEMIEDYKRKRSDNKMVRVNHESWWKREIPSREEMDNGIANIKKVQGKIDYVLSHSLPADISFLVGGPSFFADPLVEYFKNEVVPLLTAENTKWYTGHYHIEDKGIFNDNITYILKYHYIERII